MTNNQIADEIEHIKYVLRSVIADGAAVHGMARAKQLLNTLDRLTSEPVPQNTGAPNEKA